MKEVHPRGAYPYALWAVITETVSITTVSTESHISPMVQPDASTNITVQLTTLTGTSPSVDVACLVEGVSSGT